ncbi:MAG: cation transporter [Pirellulaceae bacterium]|nr:cation transporter [Planctomycetales bacterium]
MRAQLQVMAVLACFVSAGVAQAATEVTVKNVHLCCGACVTGVKEALQDLDGVKFEASMKDKTVSITARDDAAAQKAIDSLAAAGFHGKVDSETLKFKPVETPEGKVKRLQVGGVHNCCGACNKAIKGAIAKVDGVQADTAKPRESSFVVEGNFSAAELIEALLDAGFHVKVEK